MKSLTPNTSLNGQLKDKQILTYFKSLPRACFSDEGIEVISRRFKDSGGSLDQIMADILIERRGENGKRP